MARASGAYSWGRVRDIDSEHSGPSSALSCNGPCSSSPEQSLWQSLMAVGKWLIQLWNNKLFVESPLELRFPALCTWLVLVPVKPPLFLLIEAELSEPFKNWIGGTWNLIADKLRILVNVTTLLEDGISRIRATFACVFVSVSAEILYICITLFFYLSRAIWYVGCYKIFSALVWVDRLITHEWAIQVFLNKWQ